MGGVSCEVVGFAIPEKRQSEKRKGRSKPTLIHKRRVNENTYVGYHETLSSQPKSSTTYVPLHKSIAEGVLANEEEPDRHKTHGSSVVSMYVGETEKNLSQIFLKEESNNLLLFFEGANVLVGKRSTVNHGGGTF